jgi:hypothetical protein
MNFEIVSTLREPQPPRDAVTFQFAKIDKQQSTSTSKDAVRFTQRSFLGLRGEVMKHQRAYRRIDRSIIERKCFCPRRVKLHGIAKVSQATPGGRKDARVGIDSDKCHVWEALSDFRE